MRNKLREKMLQEDEKYDIWQLGKITITRHPEAEIYYWSDVRETSVGYRTVNGKAELLDDLLVLYPYGEVDSKEVIGKGKSSHDVKRTDFARWIKTSYIVVMDHGMKPEVFTTDEMYQKVRVGHK